MAYILLFHFIFQFVDRCARLPLHNKYANVNIIDPAELCPPNEILLGEGSYGPCLLRHYKCLNVKVAQKQSLLHNTKEILKEAQIMQALKPRLHKRFFARAGDAIFSNFVASPARKGGYTW